MEPSLVVIGVSYRTASLAIRERFFMDDSQRDEAVQCLIQREGIDEIAIFSTRNRTEFYVWSQDASEASSSVLRFLTNRYDLKLSEWSSFYRLVGDPALVHILRVASGLDTQVYTDTDVLGLIKMQWQQSKRSGTTGLVLDSVVAHGFEVAERIRREAWAGVSVVPLPFAVVEQCREVFPDIGSRMVLVLGSGQVASAVTPALKEAGVEHIAIASSSADSALKLAEQTASVAVPYEECAQEVFNADVVICASSSRQPILTAAGLDPLMRSRSNRSLLIVDLGVPRNVESAVRGVPGVFLYDTDDLTENLQNWMPTRPSAAAAEAIVQQESADFLGRLLSNGTLPAIAALRKHLEQLCEEELQYVSERYGPLTEDQMIVMRAFGAHMNQRVSAAIARHITQADTESTHALAEAIEQVAATQSRPIGNQN